MIEYTSSVEQIRAEQLTGFFEGWPNPPLPETHLRLLQGSAEAILAVDPQTGEVVGFITAMTDGVLSAYIPLLEIRPEWRGQGIGHELVRLMLARLKEFYMIDLLCDPELVPFYESLGMVRATGMMVRNRRVLVNSRVT